MIQCQQNKTLNIDIIGTQFGLLEPFICNIYSYECLYISYINVYVYILYMYICILYIYICIYIYIYIFI